MVFFNYALRKLNAKIVYYGPGLCGKTTNLVWIHDHFEGGERGRMISLATEGDRTIFFDLLPIEIGSIRGMDVTLQLYTVPGQVHYNSTRQLVLRGADGVVFVGDSQQAMQSSNIDSFKNLQENLLLQGISLDGFPHALQFNKRDLKDIVSVEDLDDDLNVYRVPIFEAVATDGIGVQETLEGIVKLVMRSLRERYEGATTGWRTPGVKDATVTRTSVSAPETAQGPTVVPTPESPPVAPPPPAAPPPMGQDFSSHAGAETVDFSKTYGAETFDEISTVGFEDEISTGVYELGDEETGTLQNLGAPSQPDLPAAELELPVTSTPDFDIGSTVTDGMPPPSALEAGGELFTEIPTDPGIKASEIDEVSKIDEMEIPDFELDIPSNDKPATPEPQPIAATPEVPEFEAVPPLAAPEVPEFEAFEPPAAAEVPELEAIETPVAPEVPEFEAAESLSVDPAASGLEVTPPVVESEIPEVALISTPETGDVEPPSADLPPLGERYEDRIEAPSPFAPHPQASAGVEDIPEVLGVAADQAEDGLVDTEPEEVVTEAESTFDIPEVLGVAADQAEDGLVDTEPEEIVTEAESAFDIPEVLGVAADQAEDGLVDVEPEEVVAEVESAFDIQEVLDAATDRAEDGLDDVEPEEVEPEEVEPEEVEPEVESALDIQEVLGAATDRAEDGLDDVEPEEVEPEVESAIDIPDVLGAATDRVEDFLADVEPEEAAAEEVEPEEVAAELESAITDAEADMMGEATLEPIVIGNGEPWSEEEITGVLETTEVEMMEAAAIEPAGRRDVAVRAEDNQLHLRLQGTGAIIESGQMRELDIEVPVPGSWVGNRRVTLQLRLTLIPDTEDENGESGSPS